MKKENSELAQLRASLRSEPGALSIDEAARPLIARHFEGLLAFCEKLTRGARRRTSLEGGDLATDAWMAALRRLTSDEATEIADDEHFRRLLFRVAQTRFYDAIDREASRDEIDLDVAFAVREGESDGSGVVRDQLVARERAEGALFFGGGGRALPVVEAVFLGDDALRERAGVRPRRKARHFQSMVLFFLAEHFRDEIGSSYGEAATLFRRYLELLSIPAELWGPMEDVAMRADSTEMLLFEKVNELCGTNLHDRAGLSTLRYELGQLAR